MGAKVNIVGTPQALRIKDNIVTFKIITGPTQKNPPKGLPMFKGTSYYVQCNTRQYHRGRAGDDDHSDFIIEGYQEPRLDEKGNPCIAVVAMSFVTRRRQDERKLTQIMRQVQRAEEMYNETYDKYGPDAPQTKNALETLEGNKAGLLNFINKHPELDSPI